MNALRAFLSIILLAVGLAGCGTLNEVADDRAAHIVVRAGVAEFINGDANRAASVIAWTEEAMGLIEGNPEILLSELRDWAIDSIPWDELSPGRQIIATETLLYVEAEVKERVEAGELPADATVGLVQFLETARWQAEFSLELAQR